MNSRNKGKAGERELAKVLQKYGYNTRRGQQYSGIGVADVIGIDHMHIECKRCQQVRDEAFLDQAENDAKNEVPVVMYRRNHEEWKALLKLDTFMTIWTELTEEQKEKIICKIGQNRKNDKVK